MGELSLPIDRFRVPRLDEMGDLPSRAYRITSREYAYLSSPSGASVPNADSGEPPSPSRRLLVKAGSTRSTESGMSRISNNKHQ
jgi:hypothetical protein